MSTRYTIGELSEEADLPVSTVRYYERIGLLCADGRTAANYRYYHPATVERVRFIREAQSAGFTLGDISHLLAAREGASDSCKEVSRLIAGRLEETRRQIEALQSAADVLSGYLEVCGCADPDSRCHVFDRLAAASSKPARRDRKRHLSS